MGGNNQIIFIRRIVTNIIVLGGAFFAPPWLVLCVGVAGLFVFENYCEILIAGCIMDVLYGVSRFVPFSILYSGLSLVCWGIAAGLKKHLKFY